MRLSFSGERLSVIRPADREWLHALRTACADMQASELPSFTPPAGNVARHAAVLMLFTDSPPSATQAQTDIPARESALPHVLMLQRSHDMRSHAGQMAFPGGAQDPSDQDAVAAALREAHEETGLDPGGVEVVGVLPTLWLPPSNFDVTPIVGLWSTPSAVHAVDPAETASVHLVAVDALVEPENRVTIRHFSGYLGHAFLIDGLVIWGFTAGLLSRLLVKCGWDRPWDESRVMDLPDELTASSLRDHRRTGSKTPATIEATDSA